MQHDVRRLDRLISDISDASRLDAELARGDAGPVDLAELARARWSRWSPIRRAATASTLKLTVERRGAARPTRLRRDRPRFPPGAGDHQSHRQRVFVLEAGRRGARRACAARAGSRPPTASRGGERGVRDRRRRRPRHSAARARAHLRALLHRPAGGGIRPEFRARACRSRVRSSKRTAGGSGPRTASAETPANRPTTTTRPTPPRRGRALRRRPAGDRSVSATPPGWTSPACDGARRRRERRAAARSIGRRQERARAGVDRAARERGCFAALVADDRVFARAFGGRLLARGAPGFDGHDRAALRRRDRGRRTSRPRWSGWSSISPGAAKRRRGCPTRAN